MLEELDCAGTKVGSEHKGLAIRASAPARLVPTPGSLGGLVSTSPVVSDQAEPGEQGLVDLDKVVPTPTDHGQW